LSRNGEAVGGGSPRERSLGVSPLAFFIGGYGLADLVIRPRKTGIRPGFILAAQMNNP
jgi:hypothetical protein